MTVESKQASGYVSRISLKSRTKKWMAFKLKTNAPKRYAVRPICGSIAPDASVDVYGTFLDTLNNIVTLLIL
jgi:hypothetical protein